VNVAPSQSLRGALLGPDTEKYLGDQGCLVLCVGACGRVAGVLPVCCWMQVGGVRGSSPTCCLLVVRRKSAGISPGRSSVGDWEREADAGISAGGGTTLGVLEGGADTFGLTCTRLV
jgi:hypothetical protein